MVNTPLLLMSRTFLFSLVIIGLVALLRKSFLKKRLLYFTPPIFIGLVILLWISKMDSSLGRIHIWKLSLRLLTNQTFWQGIGHNQFNVHYNHLQASHFEETGIASKEALLANDGYYAFNEFIHWGIELGWWAGVLLLLIFCLFLYQNWRLIKRQGPFNFEFLCTMLLWPIAMGCWVGYPLHKPYLAIYALSMSLMLVVSIISPTSGQRNCFVVIIGLTAVSLSALHWWKQESAKREMAEARELWIAGDKPAAIDRLRTFCIKQPNAIPHNELLAKWLWLMGEEEKAMNWMNRHHQYHCNQRMHETLGKWYTEKMNWPMASQELHTSLYITPHRLTARALLAEMYKAMNQNDSARYWWQQLIDYPIKVPTARANQLKEQGAIALRNIENN